MGINANLTHPTLYQEHYQTVHTEPTVKNSDLTVIQGNPL